MIEGFYLDTSIWLDIYERRGLNGKQAINLIFKIIIESSIIVYSDLTIRELKHIGYETNEINFILSTAKPTILKHIHTYRKQIEQARKLAKQRNVPFKDALHAVLARDNNVQFVSRDKHFQKLKDITDTKSPETLI
ncbi:hypothetical protein CL622_06920 [archaeon]|nr:hypothetical protein [archaeon]|tara:strand:- start:159 stop:566 length:408 start_codon:yes stop_codon:yes gene_type:complete